MVSLGVHVGLGLVWVRFRIEVRIRVRVSFLGSFRVRVRFWLGPGARLNPNIVSII